MKVYIQSDTRHVEVDVKVNLYSDDTPYINFYNDGINGVNFEVTRVVVNVFAVAEFHAAMMFAHTLRVRYPHAEIILYMPYFVGARQDRRNLDGDCLFAAKYYADIVNAVRFDGVVIADPHSEVTPALLNNCTVISADAILDRIDLPNKYSGIIAPDSGATKRAFAVAKMLGIPVFQAWKYRDTSDGKLTGFGIEPIGPGRYLIVDDICDGGGTFIGLAKALPSEVKCDLYVTHGLFSKGLNLLLDHFNVYTTNSVFNFETGKFAGLTIIDIRRMCR